MTHLEVGAVAGPHVVGARGLAVVLLLGSEAQHFRWLYEAMALEQAVAAGLRYGESAGIGVMEPCPLDHGLDIQDPFVQCLRQHAVGQTAAARVEPDHGVRTGQLPKKHLTQWM